MTDTSLPGWPADMRPMDWLAMTPAGPLRERIETELGRLLMRTSPSLYAPDPDEGISLEAVLRARGWIETAEIAELVGEQPSSVYMRLFRAPWAEKRCWPDPTRRGGRRCEWRWIDAGDD